jgi:hypothetical protein
MARARIGGQGIASQAVTEQTVWIVTEWRDGKAIWTRVSQSETEALEAADLSE